MSKESPKSNKPSTYLFPQQRDSTCMLMPFYHLPILNQQQNKDGTLRHFDTKWHTKIEWLTKTFPGIRDWHKAMGRLSFPEKNENKAFSNYQNQLIRDGILKESIPQMQFQGEPYIDYDNLEPSEIMSRAYLTPYTTSITEKDNMLTKTLPIYIEKGKVFCFDPEKNDFIKLDANVNLKNNYFVKVADLNLPNRLQEFYGLDDIPYLFIGPNGFGKEAMLKANYIDKEQKMLLDKDTGFYYGEGLYLLMLFAMGVDNQNNKIVEGHPLYDAYQNFRQEMERSPLNPWNSPSFKKENFLEYHVAEILKSNPELKQNFKDNLSSLTAWPQYEKIEEIQLNGNSQKNAKNNYLPGEDLMLAYAISQNLKYLWASSLSAEKFKAILELGSLTPEEQELININELISKLKSDATSSQTGGKTFLESWKALKAEVIERVGNNTNLVSFDGHGSVKSFSPKVTHYQKQQGLADPKLFQQLGYTEIDSYYQEGTQPFYQRTQIEEKEMEKAASVIQGAFRNYVRKKQQSDRASSLDMATSPSKSKKETLTFSTGSSNLPESLKMGEQKRKISDIDTLISEYQKKNSFSVDTISEAEKIAKELHDFIGLYIKNKKDNQDEPNLSMIMDLYESTPFEKWFHYLNDLDKMGIKIEAEQYDSFLSFKKVIEQMQSDYKRLQVEIDELKKENIDLENKNKEILNINDEQYHLFSQNLITLESALKDLTKDGLSAEQINALTDVLEVEEKGLNEIQTTQLMKHFSTEPEKQAALKTLLEVYSNALSINEACADAVESIASNALETAQSEIVRKPRR